ncbi:MAG: hypothetical protein HQ580_14685 [Planctomycetes bacterium]|nr:hypothetical protein [Planctomycetota bacterium]
MLNKKQTRREREWQIKQLLAASTPDEKQRIKKGLRDGRRLRKEVEGL